MLFGTAVAAAFVGGLLYFGWYRYYKEVIN